MVRFSQHIDQLASVLRIAVCEECICSSLRARTTGSSNSMDIVFHCTGHVIVYDNLYVFHICSEFHRGHNKEFQQCFYFVTLSPLERVEAPEVPKQISRPSSATACSGQLKLLEGSSSQLEQRASNALFKASSSLLNWGAEFGAHDFTQKLRRRVRARCICPVPTLTADCRALIPSLFHPISSLERAVS